MPQEDIPQNETQIERPHTPDPNNPIQDNTEYANPNYEMPEEMPNANLNLLLQIQMLILH